MFDLSVFSDLDYHLTDRVVKKSSVANTAKKVVISANISVISLEIHHGKFGANKNDFFVIYSKLERYIFYALASLKMYLQLEIKKIWNISRKELF